MRARTSLAFAMLVVGCGADSSTLGVEPTSDDMSSTPGSTYPDIPNTATTVGTGGESTGSTMDEVTVSASSTAEPTDNPPVLSEFTVNGAAAPVPVQQAGVVELSVRVQDDHGIDTVVFYRGGEVVAQVGGADVEFEYANTEWALDSQSFEPEQSFWVVARDTAGQEVASETITLAIDLPDGGESVWYYPSTSPDAHVVWTDIAVAPDGRTLVVGWTQVDGEFPRLTSELLAPDGSTLLHNPVPSPDDVLPVKATAIAWDDGGPVYVAGKIDDVVGWFARIDEWEATEQKYAPDTEVRALANAAGVIVAAGNEGIIGETETAAAVWAMHENLEIAWYQAAEATVGPQSYRGLTIADERVAVAGYNTDQDEVTRAAVGLFEAVNGVEVWSSTAPSENEWANAVDHAADGYITVGASADGEFSKIVVRWWTDEGNPWQIWSPGDTPSAGVEELLALTVSTQGEVVFGGRICEGFSCRTTTRRYASNPWGLLWERQDGYESTNTAIVRIRNTDFGHVITLGHQMVDYGGGPHRHSMVRRLGP